MSITERLKYKFMIKMESRIVCLSLLQQILSPTAYFMGIKQLSKVIELHAKNGIKTRNIDYYTGHKIAIDASLCLYQFLIAVRSDGFSLSAVDGETTSHLIGLFSRTIKLISAGIEPLYIFDGKPPVLKQNFELNKRKIKRESAEKQFAEAKILGDKESMAKYDKRQLKVTEKHVNDAKRLLTLLKVPFVQAESEAEALASYLCKINVVDAVASEDMDCLTFGAPILLRNLNASESKKLPIMEYNLKIILKELKFTMEQFIDLCILLGCDYVTGLKGIGPKKAFEMIKKHASIEKILEKEVKTHKNLSEKKSKNNILEGEDKNYNDFNNNIIQDSKIDSYLNGENKKGNNLNNDKIETSKRDGSLNGEDKKNSNLNDHKIEISKGDESYNCENSSCDNNVISQKEVIKSFSNENISSQTNLNTADNEYNSAKKIANDDSSDDLEQDSWDYKGARKIFNTLSSDEFCEKFVFQKSDYSKINNDDVIQFLVKENNFNEDRVIKSLEKLKAIKHKPKQIKISSFFKKI